MFEAIIDQLNDRRGQMVFVQQNGQRLRYIEILNFWQHDGAFRSFFISILADAPFSAYRWETPPVDQNTINRLFECVILDDPGLSLVPDSSAFKKYFNRAGEGQEIAVFPNLGNDALLVVPCPVDGASNYGHLASFVRGTSMGQVHELWKLVGYTMARELSNRPIWLNTAGGGVPWLHIRLDSRPKYYAFGPYAMVP